MSTAVAAVKSNPDKFKTDFDALVPFFTQYIDKKAPTPSVKVASLSLRPDLPSGRRPALPVAHSRERLS